MSFCQTTEQNPAKLPNKNQPNYRMTKYIYTDKMKAPSFLMVLTAVGDYCYRRDDGVYVVPIGTLKD